MWHKYVSLIVTITCICLLVQAQSEFYQLVEKRASAKYCGSILSNMLEVVCNGVYNMQLGKKSIYDSDSEEDYTYGQQPYIDETKLPFPYRSRPHASSLISGRFRRHSRGVADECCKKSCTIEELKSYCGPDTKRQS